MLQFLKSLFLDLSDALTRELKHLADLLQSLFELITYSVAHFDYLFLSRRYSSEDV